MSATRWIHCNICFHLLSKKERKFYHLSCRHVLCKQCMAKTNRGTICPVCEKPLERFTELNNQRAVILQMKEMEDSLRQKIVETQRRYEKFRTYRRNLQETLRQMSPRYASGPIMCPTSGRSAMQQPTNYSSALPNRDSDEASSRNDRRRPNSTISSNVDCFDIPSLTNRPPSIMDGSFTRQHVATMRLRKKLSLSLGVLLPLPPVVPAALASDPFFGTALLSLAVVGEASDVGTLSEPFTSSDNSSVLSDDGTTWLLLLVVEVVLVTVTYCVARAAAVATDGVETAEDVSISEQ
uniref:RING-type domain-containing protein n=1 Tax=Anopheles culicifacies TaxID=139723 RepID=A0A182MJ44_9DIPT